MKIAWLIIFIPAFSTGLAGYSQIERIDSRKKFTSFKRGRKN